MPRILQHSYNSFSSRIPKPKLWIFSSRTPNPKLLTAKLEGTGTNPRPRIRPQENEENIVIFKFISDKLFATSRILCKTRNVFFYWREKCCWTLSVLKIVFLENIFLDIYCFIYFIYKTIQAKNLFLYSKVVIVQYVQSSTWPGFYKRIKHCIQKKIVLGYSNLPHYNLTRTGIHNGNIYFFKELQYWMFSYFVKNLSNTNCISRKLQYWTYYLTFLRISMSVL